MITYLLNFVLCSGLLLLVYRAFLGSENLYRFNRFYLLFSMVFSLVVPLVTIQIYPAEKSFVNQIDQPIIVQNLSPTIAPITIANTPVRQAIVQAPAHNYLPDVLPILYSIVAMIMLGRFARNLYTISRSVTQNKAETGDGVNLILLDEEITPHSFLNYIFINKADYHHGLIEPEIICHEQTHIKQLHSLDVIFIELLQAICWFNPFIPLYRRAVQLNHEFLADEAVIKCYPNTNAYQHLVLAKSSQYSSLYLTSQFNYLTTKKRLIMMTKNTTAATAWFARLAIIPVVTIAFLLFCNKTAVYASVKNIGVHESPAIVKNNDTLKRMIHFAPPKLRNSYPAAKEGVDASLLKEYAAIITKYVDDHKYGYKSKQGPAISVTDRNRMEEIFKQMNKQQQDQQKIGFWSWRSWPKAMPTQEQFDSWKDKNFHKVYIDDKLVSLSELGKHQPDEFANFQILKLQGPVYKNVAYRYDLNLMTVDYFNSTNKDMETPRLVYQYKNPNGYMAQLIYR